MKANAEIAILGRSLLAKEEKELSRSDLKQIILLKSAYSPNDKGLQQICKVFEGKSDHSEAHLQRIINFGHQTLIDDQSIASFFSSQTSSDWYYLRFSLFQRSRNTMILADELNDAIRELTNSTDSLQIYLEDPIPEVLIDRPAKFISDPRKRPSKKALAISFILKYLLLFGFRSIGGAFLRIFRQAKGRKMIFANPYLEQEVFDLKTAETKIGDPHLQNLIDLSLEEDECIYLTQLRPPSLEANHKLSIGSYLREKAYDSQTLYFEPYLLSALVSAKLRRAVKEINEKFKIIREHSQDKSFSDTDQLLLKRLYNLKNTMILAKWREIAAEKMWKSLKVEKVLAIDEHSLQNRSLFLAARAQGIKTYALQHGAISRANIAYRFVKEDKAFEPFPHLTFIRGEHNQVQLIANHYPEKSLSIVGHLRTDIIPLLKEKNQGESGIVYATQPMPPADASLKEQQLKDFLALCKQLPEEDFVIKPHPNESEIDRYRELAKEAEYPNLSLYEGNLYQLLASCKLLITYYSTVGLEAIYFNKEVLCLDYEKRDYQGYHAAEVAHRALNGNELIEMSRDILEGKLKTTDEKRKEFIKARAFKIDGKASERVMHSLYSIA